MNTKAKKLRDKFLNDLEYFSENAPVMLTPKKGGALMKFRFNKAQKLVHKKLETQLKETGKVRAIIIKGRQMGCSAYISARGYHKSITRDGYNVFILTHALDATNVLFKKVKTIHGNVDEDIRPEVDYFSKKELSFSNRNSSYGVGTAKSGEVGRSATTHFLHASEAAYYEKPMEVRQGVFQTVSNSPGTEIIIETTANGMDPLVWKMWNESEKGMGEYLNIFLPWFIDDEYRTKVPENFKLRPDEESYKVAYHLDDEQMFWRRNKIIEIGDPQLFKREYPATSAEAFSTSGEKLINPLNLFLARKYVLKIGESGGRIIIGCDGARGSSDNRKRDRSVYVVRNNREILKYKCYNEMNQMRWAGILIQLLIEFGEENVEEINMDASHGYGTYDRLIEKGVSIANVIHFGEKPDDEMVYFNKRAEMWSRVKEWFDAGYKKVPDSDELQQDIMCVPDWEYTSSGKKKLMAKVEIKKKYGQSPDIGDALALTFATDDPDFVGFSQPKRHITRNIEIIRKF